MKKRIDRKHMFLDVYLLFKRLTIIMNLDVFARGLFICFIAYLLHSLNAQFQQKEPNEEGRISETNFGEILIGYADFTAAKMFRMLRRVDKKFSDDSPDAKVNARVTSLHKMCRRLGDEFGFVQCTVQYMHVLLLLVQYHYDTGNHSIRTRNPFCKHFE